MSGTLLSLCFGRGVSWLANFRTRALFAVYKKEILDVLRDKRTLAIMILLPLILYPLLLLVGSQVGMMLARTEVEREFEVAFDFPMEISLGSLIADYEKYRLKPEYPRNLEEALDSGEIAAYVTLAEENGRDVYTIHYNSAQSGSSSAANRVRQLLGDYQRLLTREQLETAGLDPEIVLEPIGHRMADTAADEEKTGMFLGSILPFFLVVGVVTGAVYPAIDVTSGEKERGTLETLLTLPLSNLELMAGKFFAVASVAVASAVLNFVSLPLVGGFLVSGLIGVTMDLNVSALVLPLLITFVCILVFSLFVSAVILCVTSFAKSFKEANNYITPVLLIFMLPSMVTMIPDLNLSSATAAIPVVNILLLIKDVLILNYDLANMAIVLVSNIGYAVLAVIALAKIYNSEDVLFGAGSGLNLLERRSNIIPGARISPSDGLILYIFGMLAMFYLSSLFMIRLGFYGIAATQALIAALPILAALYLKADLRNTFKLKLPRLREVLGALLLWLGAFIAVNLLANLMLHFFLQGEEVAEQLTYALRGSNLWVSLLVVALLPAIGEELFFRGFVFSSLEGRVKPGTAIFLTSLMFSLMHIEFIRLPPTFILGLAFTLALFKTGSILVPALMHFVNNGVAVASMFYPEATENVSEMVLFTGNPLLNGLIWLAVAVGTALLGYKLLGTEKGVDTFLSR